MKIAGPFVALAMLLSCMAISPVSGYTDAEIGEAFGLLQEDNANLTAAYKAQALVDEAQNIAIAQANYNATVAIELAQSAEEKAAAALESGNSTLAQEARDEAFLAQKMATAAQEDINSLKNNPPATTPGNQGQVNELESRFTSHVLADGISDAKMEETINNTDERINAIRGEVDNMQDGEYIPMDKIRCAYPNYVVGVDAAGSPIILIDGGRRLALLGDMARRFSGSVYSM